MTELLGKRALVTGATGGLGQVIALRLSSEGCDVVVTGRQKDLLDEVAARTGARAVVADLSDRSQLEPLLQEAGDIDILIANAALPGSGALEDFTQEEIDRALEVNLANPIAMTRALLPRFRERGSGHFVYISSLSGKVSSVATSIYSATKFGLRGFAHGVRCDLYGTGIGCSVISPGFVRDAGMFVKSGVSLPRGMGTVTPDQVAKAVVRAIRKDKAEIDVAPVSLRTGALIGGLAPGISSVMQGRFGAGVSQQFVEGQKAQR